MNKSQFLRLCAGKLGLMAVAVCSAFAVSSCADDEVFDRADKTPLQISVNTVSGVSRSLIHDDFLPGGSSIGLSLYNSADGLDYDNQGYANVKFTATGDGADQTWGTTGLAPSVSANEATLVAYYPYNGADDLDLTAVPVETASQTDYMFSGPVTGINNTNADKVEITMHHALTAVRVQLVLGDYSGKADVTDISVGSPALGSAATLNAADGTLAAITGKGDMLTLPAGFTLAATGTDTDFLLVPDAEVVFGTTTVTATIGGKTYSAGIEFSKAYQQGYIYTYILTLNNSGFEVTKVKVTPWEPGDVVQNTINSKPSVGGRYIIKIKAQDESQSTMLNFEHNVIGFVGTIDWGDGKVDTYAEPVNNPEHQYPNDSKEYTILAKGTMNALKNNGSNSAFGACLQNICFIEDKCNITSLEKAFYGCKNITEIPGGLFDKCTEVTNFQSAFSGCRNLQEIPEGLFDNCTVVTDFSETFLDCIALETIPEKLFDNCTEVTNFYSVFGSSSPEVVMSLKTIPEGLFDNCTEVTSFSYAFVGCRNLQEIPVGLFNKCTKVTSFSGAFGECDALTTIPVGLFDHCTEVTNFSYTFMDCENLTNIPEGLFKHNIKVYNYNYVFGNCAGLTEIPAFTFGTEESYVNFYNAFDGCVNLKTIKTDAFYCKNIYSFGDLFNNMLSLEKIEAGAFNCPNITDFYAIFQGCRNLKDISDDMFKYNTKVLIFERAFYDCISLETIPEGLFDNCTEVTNFYSVFGTSSQEVVMGLKTIPEGLFDNNTKVTDFGGSFAGCGNLQEIPEGLFDKCTEVTNFSGTFAECVALTTIPEGLFDKCTKVTNFGWTFAGCGNVLSESPYTIINVDGVETKVHLYERENYPEYFATPNSSMSCFNECTSMTDYNSIPVEWK